LKSLPVTEVYISASTGLYFPAIESIISRALFRSSSVFRSRSSSASFFRSSQFFKEAPTTFSLDDSILLYSFLMNTSGVLSIGVTTGWSILKVSFLLFIRSRSSSLDVDHRLYLPIYFSIHSHRLLWLRSLFQSVITGITLASLNFIL